ncbi:unnamed protein product [Discosporangium mesarthrocarpum]
MSPPAQRDDGPGLTHGEREALAEHEARQRSKERGGGSDRSTGNSDGERGTEEEGEEGREEEEDGEGEGREHHAWEEEDGKSPEVNNDQGDAQANTLAQTELGILRTQKLRELDLYRSAVAFIRELESAERPLEDMMASRTITDVVEALRFLTMACHYDLSFAVPAIKKSLTLVWRSEEQISKEARNTFVEVFVNRAGGNPETGDPEPLTPQKVAANLMTLAVPRGDQAFLACLEELVRMLSGGGDEGGKGKENNLDPEVFEHLWSAVGAKGQSGWRRAGALNTLAMGALADPRVVGEESSLRIILGKGLGRRVMIDRDWSTVRCACIALQRCGSLASTSTGWGKRSDIIGGILEVLGRFVQGQWCVPVESPRESSGSKGSEWEKAAESTKEAEREMEEWFGAAEQALGAIFYLCPRPEVFCSAIIRGMAGHTLKEDSVSPLALARLCFVLGQVAFKLFVYAEDVASRMERARAKAEPEQKGGKGNRKARVSLDKESGKDSEEEEEEEADDTTARELGMNQEVQAEDEQRLAELVNKEIVGRNLLGVFGPLLVRIVADEEGQYGHPLLRDSSVLALCKYMCISADFAGKYLPLLFTVLEKAEETSVRTNIMVALGDLAFRFPNALEPWNVRIYARLRDPSGQVRANAIMVLTHLILNDMVKVKGQVSELAACIIDPEERIRDMAKLFFNEYSKRGTNPIYNVLPDIVGRLSQDESINPEDFNSVMRFLLQYVQKDKLSDSLVEKLCSRLSKATDMRQMRAISFCLASIKITEKTLLKVLEVLPSFKDCLRDKEVYYNLKAMLNKAKMFSSEETKRACEDLSAKFKEYHEEAAEDADTAERATVAKKGSRKRTSGVAAGPPRSSLDLAPVLSPESDSVVRKKKGRGKKVGRKVIVQSETESDPTLSSDEDREDPEEDTEVEDGEEDEEDVVVPRRGRDRVGKGTFHDVDEEEEGEHEETAALGRPIKSSKGIQREDTGQGKRPKPPLFLDKSEEEGEETPAVNHRKTGQSKDAMRRGGIKKKPRYIDKSEEEEVEHPGKIVEVPTAKSSKGMWGAEQEEAGEKEQEFETAPARRRRIRRQMRQSEEENRGNHDGDNPVVGHTSGTGGDFGGQGHVQASRENDIGGGDYLSSPGKGKVNATGGLRAKGHPLRDSN